MANAYKSAILSALLCLTLGCNRGGSEAHPLSRDQSASVQPVLVLDDKESYAVYDALLGEPTTSESGPNRNPLAIQDHTKVGVSCSDLSMTIDLQVLTASHDFAQQNSVERLLKPGGFDVSRKVEIIPSAELNRIFADGAKGWMEFRSTYPAAHGYIQLSAVGFSPGKNFAVVYSAVHCGPLCGAGGFTTLSKSGGVWRKNPGRRCGWIS